MSENSNVHIRDNATHTLQLFDISAPFILTRETSRSCDDYYTVEQCSFSYYHVEQVKKNHSSEPRPLHKHSFIEIMYVLSGTIDNQIESNTYQYQENQCCIMNRNIHHCENTNGTFDVLFLMISDRYFQKLIQLFTEECSIHKNIIDNCIFKLFLDSNESNSIHMKQYLDLQPFVSKQSQLSIIQSLLLHIWMETKKSKLGCHSIILGLTLRLFEMFSDSQNFQIHSMQSDISHHEFLVTMTLQIIEANHGNCTHEMLQKQLHYNAEYLNRLLKQNTGKTFREQCHDIMLSHACYYLSHTSIPVSELITDILGLTNRNYFYSLFQSRYHMTPKQYRLQNRKNT